MHVKRIFTVRRAAVAFACYVALWALTASIGCQQARRFVLTRAEITPETREMPRDSVYQCCAPAYWFHTRSYAPFLVYVSFEYARGDFAYGYTALFLWFGVLGPAIPISSSVT
jgi:hypothetical protein